MAELGKLELFREKKITRVFKLKNFQSYESSFFTQVKNSCPAPSHVFNSEPDVTCHMFKYSNFVAFKSAVLVFYFLPRGHLLFS